MQEHVPSLSHIATFVMRRGRKRGGLVHGHRKQVEAPREGRGFSYFYAKMITAAISFVSSGNRNQAIQDAVTDATHREHRSYSAVAVGLEPVLLTLGAASAARVNSSRTYESTDGAPLVAVRPHLELRWADGRVSLAYIHFGEEPLTAEAIVLVLHLVQTCYPEGAALVIDARRGTTYTARDVAIAKNPNQLLLEELDEYAMLWDNY